MGTTVTITANPPESGKIFKEWKVLSGGVTLASTIDTTTTFVMPEKAVKVAATYENTNTPATPENNPIKAPQITTHPVDVSVEEGKTAKFTVKATGTAPLSYQWMVDVKDGKGFKKITGATGTEYIIEETAIENNGFLYKCVVSNSAGSVDSNAATLTVTEKTTVVSDYKIIEGQNCTWTEGSDGSLAIRGDGEFSKFTGVKVDGKEIDKSNYSAKQGSTIITLDPVYLNSLAVQTHTVEILWTDGTALTTFTIKEKSSGNNTSNNNNNTGSNNSTTANSNIAGKVESVATNSSSMRKDDVPKTGDDTPIIWLFVIMFASGTGMLVTRKKGKKL